MIKIHGKDYVTVDERVTEFHEKYPNGSIKTQLLSQSDGRWITQAIVTPDVENPNRSFTGLAYEVEGSSQINKTSALENCETSAVGRALGFLNIGLVGSIASADEVSNAVHQQESQPEKENKYDDSAIWFGKMKGKSWSEADEGYLKWVATNMTGKPKELADAEIEKRTNPVREEIKKQFDTEEVPF